MIDIKARSASEERKEDLAGASGWDIKARSASEEQKETLAGASGFDYRSNHSTTLSGASFSDTRFSLSVAPAASYTALSHLPEPVPL